jgi:hypothetical protein
MYNSKREEAWLEPLLNEHLRPAVAPEALWDRVQYPRDTRSRSARLSLVWAPALVPLIALLIWGFHPQREPSKLQSGSAREIQAWVRANTGLDIPMRADMPPAIRLTGATLRQSSAAEVTYRAGGHAVGLVVSKTTAANSATHALPNRTRLSWSMGGQSYTLTCVDPTDLKIACLLCHTEAEHIVGSD